MKNNFIKKIAVWIAFTLCMAAMLLALAGCDGGDKATDIYITKADMPRVEYVEGQELDFSDGRLTVVSKAGESKVALIDPQVKISGYDKMKLGDQNVTIEYGGLTTSIAVTVKARMVASNFETSYFVGDSFNKRIGKLQVTTDDMKVISVNMSDDKVSLVSFDSSKAGMIPVTVSYTNGEDTYNCQFSVTVYEAAKVEFEPPYKTQYNSYDSGVNVNGGYFTVTSADSKLVKQVPLMEEMVTGFDLSAATMEHRDTPKIQTLKVEYLDREFTYEIQIRFCGISVVNYYANNGLASIDWEAAKQNGLPEETNRMAIDAIREYYNLSAEKMEQVSDEVRSVISRAGAVAVAKAFREELANFADTIAMDAVGNLYLLNPTYEQAKRDLERISDPSEKLNEYADLLRNIREEFGDNMMDAEVTIGSLTAVYTEEAERTVVEVLNHLLSIHERMVKIPAQWDAETLKAYGDDLLLVAMEIYNAGYYKNGLHAYYLNVLEPWREQKDLFDILYTYFLYDYENGREFIMNYMWTHMPLPGKLETWYRSLTNAVYYAGYLSNSDNPDAFLADTSPFMFYYLQTLELADEIKNSDDPLWQELYTVFDVEYMNYYYLYMNTGGYLRILKGMEDSEAVNILWERYYQVLKLVGNETISGEAHEEQLRAMYTAFEQLNPSELLGFLTSISNHYNNARGALPLLSYDEETAYIMFTAILRDYYAPYLNEANRPLFASLLQAMENYALIGFKDSAVSQFTALMATLIGNYNALSAADKANFDRYAGAGYTKYLMYYHLLNNSSDLVLTDREKDLFAELEMVVKEYLFAYMAIREADLNGQTISADTYAVTCALRSQAYIIYNTILEEGSEDALNWLYVHTYDMHGDRLTLAQAYFLVDEYCVSIMGAGIVNIMMEDGTTQQVSMWDVYTRYGVSDILAQLSELMYQSYFCQEMVLDADYVISLMAVMRQMPPAQRSFLSVMGAADAYYKSVSRYLYIVLSENALQADVAANILKAEIAYAGFCANEENAQFREDFMNFMEQLIAVYDTLTEADKRHIGETYHYYLRIYEQMKAEAAA